MITTARQRQMTLGSIRITNLPDGYALFNIPFLFPETTPADWEPYQHLLNQDKQIVASIGAYVIQTSGHTIVADAGFGPGQYVDEGNMELHGGELLASLQKAGLTPADIDLVFITHLHPDHVNGIIQQANGEQGVLYPNARFLLRRSEWQRMATQAERYGVEEAVRLLEPRVELIEENTLLVPEITVLATPGHVSGHASLLIEAGEQRVILLGDVFHNNVQVEHPEWRNVFDRDHEQAVKTRLHILEELAKPATIGIASHFATDVFGRVTVAQGKYQWHTLAE
ncbi:MBL fold metallo-hydrolase [Ktedonospora formicarum]|uniref:MBL fold metallo-hydrolase n=1 Tax=Ktedonospora formicarum TaxID=2778364 RepID=A0A8J3IHF2_9CHLR|nr:MBL fold metallo-hydrolase [Ktedonospora formicarum]GHO51189.1 MBL fold metallo-hydrolase [Ktedonospora formicarum]